MKVIAISLLLFVSVVACFAKLIVPQTLSLVVRLEVDGKEVLNPIFKILIEADGQQIEPAYTKNGFVVPREISTAKEISLHFKSGKYDLFFPSIKGHNFDTEWLIGIDIPPLNLPDDTPEQEDGKKLAMVYYIEFRPNSFEGSRWVKKVYQ